MGDGHLRCLARYVISMNRKPAITTSISRKRAKLPRAAEPDDPEADAALRPWFERTKMGPRASQMTARSIPLRDRIDLEPAQLSNIPVQGASTFRRGDQWPPARF
jgi:hypothetical protein